MTRVESEPVRTAIVLAAGNGDRFHRVHDHHQTGGGSKLVHEVAGRPLILRTLESVRAAGITSVTVVVGYEADRLRALIDRRAPDGLAIGYAHNPEWRLENGVSVLAARPMVRHGHFALLMGDHLFTPAVLDRLRRLPTETDVSVLAVDARPIAPDAAAEATKVRLDGDRIQAIGKDLEVYDAVDTGLFVCAPVLFDALEAARGDGDTTLSGGIRRLAARGLMRAFDVEGAPWLDIDTPSDLAAAESVLLAAEPA